MLRRSYACVCLYALDREIGADHDESAAHDCIERSLASGAIRPVLQNSAGDHSGIQKRLQCKSCAELGHDHREGPRVSGKATVTLVECGTDDTELNQCRPNLGLGGGLCSSQQ